jgi:large subunit ribosomal protein L9
MKIILIETLDKIGKSGEVINVKDGFARNYLFPKKYAIPATTANMKKIESIEAEAKAKADKKNEEYRQMAEKIATLQATFSRRAEEDGKLFGSVSETDIIKFLADNDVVCHKSNVLMDKHIKNTGEFDINISYTGEISANLKVIVEASL